MRVLLVGGKLGKSGRRYIGRVGRRLRGGGFETRPITVCEAHELESWIRRKRGSVMHAALAGADNDDAVARGHFADSSHSRTLATT